MLHREGRRTHGGAAPRLARHCRGRACPGDGPHGVREGPGGAVARVETINGEHAAKSPCAAAFLEFGLQKEYRGMALHREVAR